MKTAVLATLGLSCAVTTTEAQTWTVPAGAGWSRPGHVESVQEIVERIQGNPPAVRSRAR